MKKSEPSQEFLERKALFEFEKEIVELRHQYKMEELKVQREISIADHKDRMSEIRLKNRNIQRSIEEKDRRIRDYHEKRRQRFAEKNNGEPSYSEEEEN